MEKDLTAREAYLAMVNYVKNLQLRVADYYLHDFLFLSDMQFSLDGGTMDPAAWYDWLDAISEIKTIEIIPPGKELTVQEGYIAMLVYLENLYKRKNSDELGNFLSLMQFAPECSPTDSAAWSDWLEVVKKVKTTPFKDLIEENTFKFV